MLNSTELKENHFYFHLFFVTNKTAIPEIRTYFYLGKNLYDKKPEDTVDYYFQESESYQKHGSALNKKNLAKYDILIIPNESYLSNWYDLPGLINKLQNIKDKKSFQIYTDKAQKVIILSKEAAIRLNSDSLYSEHLLLGLIEVESPALVVLRKLGISPENIRLEIKKFTKQKPKVQKTKEIPFSDDAQRALRLTAVISREFGHDTIGTEHFLLALVREETGKAHQVLTGLGLNTELVSKEILDFE